MLFLPQHSTLLRDGSLRAALAYPEPPGKFAERGISRMRECCWMLTRKEDA